MGDVPPPGCFAAHMLGCVCSSMANNQGIAKPDDGWDYNDDCTVHIKPPTPETGVFPMHEGGRRAIG